MFLCLFSGSHKMFSSFPWLFLPHRISRRFIFVIFFRSLVISLCSVCVVLQSVHELLCCCCFMSSNCFMMCSYVCFYVFFYPFSSVSVFMFLWWCVLIVCFTCIYRSVLSSLLLFLLSFLCLLVILCWFAVFVYNLVSLLLCRRFISFSFALSIQSLKIIFVFLKL